MSGEHIPFVWHLLQDIPLEEIDFYVCFLLLFRLVESIAARPDDGGLKMCDYH